MEVPLQIGISRIPPGIMHCHDVACDGLATPGMINGNQRLFRIDVEPIDIDLCPDLTGVDRVWLVYKEGK